MERLLMMVNEIRQYAQYMQHLQEKGDQLPAVDQLQSYRW